MENDSEDKNAMDEFFGLQRNYIILTNSGKPVFSYKGDMYLLSSIYATLYAIISKAQTYELLEVPDPDLEIPPISIPDAKTASNPYEEDEQAEVIREIILMPGSKSKKIKDNEQLEETIPVQ